MELQKYTTSNPIEIYRLYSDPNDVFDIDRILNYKKAGMDGDTYNFYRNIKYTPEENEEHNNNIVDFVKSFTTLGYITSDPIDYKSLDDEKKSELLELDKRVKVARLILKGAIINMITPEIVKQANCNDSVMTKKLYLYCDDDGTIHKNETNSEEINKPSMNNELLSLIQGNIAEITFDFFIKMIKNDMKEKYSDVDNDENFGPFFKELLHWDTSVLDTGEEGKLARNIKHINDKNDFILKYIRREIIMDITQDPPVFYIESKDILNYKISETNMLKPGTNILKPRTNILIESFNPKIISESPDTLPDHILSKINPIFLANEMIKKPTIIEAIKRKIPENVFSKLDSIINAIKTYLKTQANPYNKPLNMGSVVGAGIKHTKRKSKKIRRRRQKRSKRSKY